MYCFLCKLDKDWSTSVKYQISVTGSLCLFLHLFIQVSNTSWASIFQELYNYILHIIYTNKFVYIYKYVWIYTSMFVYIYININTIIYIYININIYTNNIKNNIFQREEMPNSVTNKHIIVVQYKCHKILYSIHWGYRTVVRNIQPTKVHEVMWSGLGAWQDRYMCFSSATHSLSVSIIWLMNDVLNIQMDLGRIKVSKPS